MKILFNSNIPKNLKSILQDKDNAAEILFSRCKAEAIDLGQMLDETKSKLNESNNQILELNQKLINVETKEQVVSEKASSLEIALSNAYAQIQRLEISLADKPKDTQAERRRASIRPQTAAWIKSSSKNDSSPEEAKKDIEELLVRAQDAEEDVRRLQKQLEERELLGKTEHENVGRLSSVINESQQQLQKMSSKFITQDERTSHLKQLIEKLEMNVKASTGRAIKAEGALQVNCDICFLRMMYRLMVRIL